jgi:hypothetical protein
MAVFTLIFGAIFLRNNGLAVVGFGTGGGDDGGAGGGEEGASNETNGGGGGGGGASIVSSTSDIDSEKYVERDFQK